MMTFRTKIKCLITLLSLACPTFRAQAQSAPSLPLETATRNPSGEPTQAAQAPSPMERAKDFLIGSRDSGDNRARSQFNISIIPVSLGWILPTKNGLVAAWILNEDWSLEAEYLRSSYGLGFLGVDIADLSERHLSLHAQYYVGNSFYVKSGLGHRAYQASFGSEYLDEITYGYFNGASDVEISNEVLHLGLGNRWTFDNGLSLGVEWLDLIFALGKGQVRQNILGEVKDVGERNDLHKLFDYFRYGTTFQTMKLSLGYTF